MADWLKLVPVWEVAHVPSQGCMRAEILKNPLMLEQAQSKHYYY